MSQVREKSEEGLKLQALRAAYAPSPGYLRARILYHNAVKEGRGAHLVSLGSLSCPVVNGSPVPRISLSFGKIENRLDNHIPTSPAMEREPRDVVHMGV